MELVFLGTGAAYPSPHRGASSLILRLESGDCWMFDCGEGTQIQLMRSIIKPGKVNKVFISHLHGDHLFGLPGLLCTLSQNSSRTEPVEIYGPRGLRKFVRSSLELSRSELIYQYRVNEIIACEQCCNDKIKEWEVDESCNDRLHPNELSDGLNVTVDEQGYWNLIDDGKVKVKAGRLQHLIPSYGYVIEESDQPGSLDVATLRCKGVQPGPQYRLVKSGHDITSPSGEVIHSRDVIGPTKVGRKVCILGDTSDSSAMTSLAVRCDVIVHEATLENGRREDAVEKGHSTPGMAADFANSISAKMLILTHFSQRYKKETDDYNMSIEQLVDQAGQVYKGHLFAAEDLLSLPIPKR